MAGLIWMLCLADAEAQALRAACQATMYVNALDKSSMGSLTMSNFAAAEAWLGGVGNEGN